MSEISRTFIENACEHIITRGNQKQQIFRDDKDYEQYLKIVKKAKRKYRMLLLAYCLMTNHVHMLIKSEIPANISKFMHRVNRVYAGYFNEKYGKVGHLWQGRFKNKSILKDDYLVACAEYIEGNPVRSGIVRYVTEYNWSSYRERCLSSGSDMLDDLGKHI